MNKLVTVNVTELRTFICPGHDGVRLEELGEQEFHPDIAQMIVDLGYGEFVNVAPEHPEESVAQEGSEDLKRVDHEWGEDDEAGKEEGADQETAAADAQASGESEDQTAEEEVDTENSEAETAENDQDLDNQASEKSEDGANEDKAVEAPEDKGSTGKRRRGKKPKAN